MISDREQEFILEYHSSTVRRLEHIEKLLLGLATVGLAGWAFLHVQMSKGETSAEQVAVRVMFTAIFSGLIATAFNGLYMARMSINQSILDMEELLNTKIKPFEKYFSIIGSSRARITYWMTASFLPGMSIASFVISLFEFIDRHHEISDRNAIKWITIVLWTCLIVPTIWSTLKNFAFIRESVRNRLHNQYKDKK